MSWFLHQFTRLLVFFTTMWFIMATPLLADESVKHRLAGFFCSGAMETYCGAAYDKGRDKDAKEDRRLR
jgi:hypothetical protein